MFEAVDLVQDGESQETAYLRRQWEEKQTVLNHFESQLEELRRKQRSLIRALSNGFNGNIKAVISHMSAVTRALEDIESLESQVRGHSTDVKEKRRLYLSALNDDDHRVLVEAQGLLNQAKERLEDIDPTEVNGIQTELGIIRLSKTRVALLQKTISGRAHEMEELAASTEGLTEAVDNDDTQELSSEVGDSTDGKGKKKKTGGAGKKSVQRSRGTSVQDRGTRVEIANAQLEIYRQDHAWEENPLPESFDITGGCLIHNDNKLLT